MLPQLGAAIAAVVALGACGGEPRPIPSPQAAGLIADLEEAQRRTDAGACNDLQKGTFLSLERKLERLPDDIDSDVEQALRDGVGHLKDVADEECQANRPAQPTTTAPTTVPMTTTPAPTTSTTPPTDAPKGGEQEAPTTTEPPPPKDPDPPADNPGGGAPSQSGEQGGDEG